MARRHLFSDRHLNIIAYCAEEVRRQRDTPLHVGYMVQAWEHAWTQTVIRAQPLTVALVEEIGALVAPDHNLGGFRKHDVRVGYNVKMPWQQVPRAMDNLFEAWQEGRLDGFTHELAGTVGPPERLYYEFEEIHPFGDGNGRTGKVIYNAALGMLHAPKWPPDFFGGYENP
jgi:Fic family protein